MSTAYGNKIHSRWRAILSYSVTTTATQVTVTCKSGFQFINNANYDGSATHYSIIDGTKVQPSGSWSVSTNGTKYINTKTITYTRGTSAATKTIAFSSYIAGSYAPGTSSGSVSISVPALQSYTIQFNNNGGTGTIANITKYYGKNATLPSSGFTRTGYKFLGWSTSNTATTATYAPGATYTANAGAILYAVWQAVLIPHTVTNVKAERYSNGVQDDEGTSCHVSFVYTPATIAEEPQALSYEIYVYESGSTIPSTPIDSGTLNSDGGTFDKTVIGTYSINDIWEVDINVFVASQPSMIVAKTSELPTAKFPFDALADGSAVGIMMPAQEGVDVSLPANTRVGGIPIGCPFPVHAIYMSMDSSDPSTIWSGTTWQRISQGKVLVGVDENDNDFRAGITDADNMGAKSVKLTAAQSGVPAHTHPATIELTAKALGSGSTYSRANNGGTRYSDIVNVNKNDAKDASLAHNNLQPYITCYIWQRTA